MKDIAKILSSLAFIAAVVVGADHAIGLMNEFWTGFVYGILSCFAVVIVGSLVFMLYLFIGVAKAKEKYLRQTIAEPYKEKK